ncbi:endonuclease/exonuclease/phosphatase family protein [Massilia sp. SR12]
MRIATWNLERPKLNGHIKNARRIEKIKEINADLWVLTETHSVIALDGYTCLAAPHQPGYHTNGESFATIWSRWPIRRAVPTFDPYFAVCAEVISPAGPMLVFGTVITYANDRGLDGNARRWEEHRKSISSHAADWLRLRAEFPSHLLCVAGDFNQSRDGTGWYEDADSVAKLSFALDQSSLKCVSELDMRANGLSRATIDHICISRSLANDVRAIGAWEGSARDGFRMSDHNGVFIDLDAQLGDQPDCSYSTICNHGKLFSIV